MNDVRIGCSGWQYDSYTPASPSDIPLILERRRDGVVRDRPRDACKVERQPDVRRKPRPGHQRRRLEDETDARVMAAGAGNA